MPAHTWPWKRASARARSAADANVPAGHCVHVGEDALPVEYEPAGQGAVHADVVKPDDAP